MTDLPGLDHARRMDREDPLAEYRRAFHIPPHGDGEQYYFCGNSLGLQPRQLHQYLEQFLRDWRKLGVAAHFEGEYPWMPYHEFLREPLARLTGAGHDEVVAMNSLTTNLHLLMVSFYRPAGRRNKILIEKQAFPSDRYAVASQIRFHGLDPADCLVELGNPEDRLLDEAVIEDYLRDHPGEVALVLMPGVQYATGQVLDIGRISRAAHGAGALAGFDLAHAIGNIPLNLHEDACDFAVWCSYKYLNAGPGNIAGCFVHQRHSGRTDLPRFEGWWGHDPASRFRMDADFAPAPGADAWQLSNPPILGLVALRASLDLFRRAGMAALTEKSRLLTGYLFELVTEYLGERLEILTPADEKRRGAQLSLRVRQGRDTGRALFEQLEKGGYICDWREPDILRLAPVPLYNRFEDVHAVVTAIREFFDDDD